MIKTAIARPANRQCAALLDARPLAADRLHITILTLDDLAVRDQMLVAACARSARRFSSHLTLGYRDGAAWSKRVAPVEWLAGELVLVHSHVGRTRHDVLGRWRLSGPVDPQLALF